MNLPIDVPTGAASLGIYTQMTHDRPEDLDYMRQTGVSGALIMDPTTDKVSKLWHHMLSYGADDPVIILRKWEWDDGRSGEGDKGVYETLRRDPLGKAEWDIENWSLLVNGMIQEANNRRISFPKKEQLRCHLVNEPDTNYLLEPTDIYTVRASELAVKESLRLLTHNLGTGHPVQQVSGPGSSPDWGLLYDSIHAAYENNHTIANHEYYNSLGIKDPDVLFWHIFRHKWAWKFLSEWNLLDIEWWLTEHGLEELVNNVMNEHHGWLGRISAWQFADNYEYFATNVACFVDRVFIYASDLPDRVWKTFDPRPALPYIAEAAGNVYEYIKENETFDCGKHTVPPNPDGKEIIIPLSGPITQRFGENHELYYQKFGIPGHNGIDIAAKNGAPIVAAANGVVEWVDWDNNYGWYIRIWHEQLHMHTFYAHMKDESFLSGGDMVKQGDVIGYVGSTGFSSGPHLHFETRMGDRYRYFDVHYGYRHGRSNPEAIYAAHGIEW